MRTDEIIGIIAGIFTSASMLPQVITTIRKKDAEEVSLGMLIMLIAGVLMWIVYGAMKNDLPILATNSFSMLVNIVMIFLRIKYGKK